MPKPKVLFICLGNSCRSIMAEALARHRCGDRWEAASAGINPLGFVAPETLTVLTEIGVSLAGLYSKGLEKYDFTEYGLLINLSDHSLQGRILPAHTGKVLHRPVPDPYGCGLGMYRQSREAVLQVIIRELCREEEPGP
jgi:arsenate reductase